LAFGRSIYPKKPGPAHRAEITPAAATLLADALAIPVGKFCSVRWHLSIMFTLPELLVHVG
jgi:hypothetical protein